jgi:hypothetical protein
MGFGCICDCWFVKVGMDHQQEKLLLLPVEGRVVPTKEQEIFAGKMPKHKTTKMGGARMAMES